MAPAHFKELKDVTDALVTGKVSVKKALSSGDPALRAHIENFIDKYAFATDPEILEQLRKAKIAQGLTHNDLIISLGAVKLAQKEAELEAAKGTTTTGLSDEIQEIINRVKQAKVKDREAKEKALKDDDET